LQLKERLRKLQSQIKSVRELLPANVNFVMEQFREHMDNVVTDAKSEIEGFVTGHIQRTGLEALKGQVKVPEMIEGPKGDDNGQA